MPTDRHIHNIITHPDVSGVGHPSLTLASGLSTKLQERTPVCINYSSRPERSGLREATHIFEVGTLIPESLGEHHRSTTTSGPPPEVDATTVEPASTPKLRELSLHC